MSYSASSDVPIVFSKQEIKVPVLDTETDLWEEEPEEEPEGEGPHGEAMVPDGHGSTDPR